MEQNPPTDVTPVLLQEAVEEVVSKLRIAPKEFRPTQEFYDALYKKVPWLKATYEENRIQEMVVKVLRTMEPR